jgi:hypothetical protein
VDGRRKELGSAVLPRYQNATRLTRSSSSPATVNSIYRSVSSAHRHRGGSAIKDAESWVTLPASKIVLLGCRPPADHTGRGAQAAACSASPRPIIAVSRGTQTVGNRQNVVVAAKKTARPKWARGGCRRKPGFADRVGARKCRKIKAVIKVLLESAAGPGEFLCRRRAKVHRPFVERHERHTGVHDLRIEFFGHSAQPHAGGRGDCRPCKAPLHLHKKARGFHTPRWSSSSRPCRTPSGKRDELRLRSG